MIPSDDMSAAGFGATALAHLLFALYLGYVGRGRDPRALIRVLPVGALLATAAWSGCEAAATYRPGPAWPAAAALFDLLRYALWFAFLLRLVGQARTDRAVGVLSRLRSALVACVVVAATLQALRIAAGGAELNPSKLVIISLLALPLGGGLLLEQLFRNLGDDSRWNAKPFCIGLACVFGFDVYLHSTALMFGAYDPDAQSVRGAVHALALPFLLVAARRSANWIARLQVSRTVAFHSATLLLAGVYLLFMSSIGYYLRFFGGSWGRALQLNLLFAAVALGVAFMLSGSLRAKLRVLLGKHFFSYRFDYREEWLRFTAKLSTQGSPAEVGQHVIRGLADMVECPSACLWIRPEPQAPFAQAARWNMPATEVDEAADSPFSQFLRRTWWVIDLDEFRGAPGSYPNLVLPNWLLALPDPWLVVPLQVGNDLLGFVVLGRPRTPIDVDWEVLDLLKTASRQAAGYLAQMHATEALLEARKFEAFNRMSAFVVHDLKNIVAQLSLMLKNAERLHANPEFQQDMLLTVESTLEKMRRLMLQLREGAAPPGGSSGVELVPIVSRLQAMAASQGRTLEVASLERLATRGHDDRLERVLGHLVQNALDATPAGGRVWIGVERFSGQVLIEVGDTGAGMSDEFIQTRLFKPFNTTKHNGMGVGSYESHQYVRELGGSIGVDSEPGRGTVMTVHLPLFDRAAGSDLMPLDAAR
jgi:putative PEP-CTERM system histidine kinase